MLIDTLPSGNQMHAETRTDAQVMALTRVQT